MNWFEDDRGNWFNLQKAKAVYPPGSDAAGNAELEFSDRDRRLITPAEWGRLLSQLRNSQNPDRRPLPLVERSDTDPSDTDPSQNID